MNYLSVLANLIAVFHGIFFVFFLVFGAILSVIGLLKKHRWAEYIFIFVIIYTILSFLLWGSCFFTILEQDLRNQAGELSYTGGFISHYLAEIGIQVLDINVFWFLVISIVAGTIAEIYWNRQALRDFFSKIWSK
jgi:hypothetical protein